MSLLFSHRVHSNGAVPNLKKRSKMPLRFVLLILTALLSPAVVYAVTTPSVAPGVTPSVLYYHPDATGNLIAMTDASGQVAWRAEMRPFGLGSANPENQPPHFLDQPLEAEIGAEGGLYHLGARTYDPVTGRFLTTDPLPLIAIPREEPQRFNRYAYGLNNPYRYMDPTGLQADPRDIEEKISGPVRDPAEQGPDPSKEVTEISPVRTGQTTPSLGEVIPEGFDPENPENVDTEVGTDPDAPLPDDGIKRFEYVFWFDPEDWEEGLRMTHYRLLCARGLASCSGDPVWDLLEWGDPALPPVLAPLPLSSPLPVPTAPVPVPVRVPVPVFRF